MVNQEHFRCQETRLGVTGNIPQITSIVNTNHTYTGTASTMGESISIGMFPEWLTVPSSRKACVRICKWKLNNAKLKFASPDISASLDASLTASLQSCCLCEGPMYHTTSTDGTMKVASDNNTKTGPTSCTWFPQQRNPPYSNKVYHDVQQLHWYTRSGGWCREYLLAFFPVALACLTKPPWRMTQQLDSSLSGWYLVSFKTGPRSMLGTAIKRTWEETTFTMVAWASELGF